MGVRDPRYYPKRFFMNVRDPNGCEIPAILSEKVLYRCERPAVLSEKFCMGVRDLRCNPKSSVAQEKTHGHVYHLDLELSDRSQG